MFVLAVVTALQVTTAPAVISPHIESAVDAGIVEEAALLLEEEGFEEQLLRSTALNVEAMVAVMASNIQKQTGEALPKDFLEQLRTLLLDHTESTIRANMRSIKDQAAAIYAQEFTRDELVRLRRIAGDPVMVKARERMKVMEPKLMVLGLQVMREAEADLEAKVIRLVTEFLADKTPGRDGS